MLVKHNYSSRTIGSVNLNSNFASAPYLDTVNCNECEQPSQIGTLFVNWSLTRLPHAPSHREVLHFWLITLYERFDQNLGSGMNLNSPLSLPFLNKLGQFNQIHLSLIKITI